LTTTNSPLDGPESMPLDEWRLTLLPPEERQMLGYA
jgi:hypothetical protein